MAATGREGVAFGLTIRALTNKLRELSVLDPALLVAAGKNVSLAGGKMKNLLMVGAVAGMLAAIGCVAAVTATQPTLDDTAGVSRGPSSGGSSFPEFGAPVRPSTGGSSFPEFGAPVRPSTGGSSFPEFGAPGSGGSSEPVRTQEIDRSLVPQNSASGNPSPGSSSFPTFGYQSY
jgi:hypothetical protein